MAESVRQAIEQRVRVFEAAFNQGDMAALAALYTEDAALMPPDSNTITGRPAIQQFWQSVQDAGMRHIVMSTQQVESSGELATEVATADLTAEAGDGTTSTIPLKYVVVWRREADGQWRLAVDIWNSCPAV